MTDPRLSDPLTLPEVGNVVELRRRDEAGQLSWYQGFTYGRDLERHLRRTPLAALLLAGLSGFLMGLLVMWVVR